MLFNYEANCWNLCSIHYWLGAEWYWWNISIRFPVSFLFKHYTTFCVMLISAINRWRNIKKKQYKTESVGMVRRGKLNSQFVKNESNYNRITNNFGRKMASHMLWSTSSFVFRPNKNETIDINIYILLLSFSSLNSFYMGSGAACPIQYSIKRTNAYANV